MFTAGIRNLSVIILMVLTAPLLFAQQQQSVIDEGALVLQEQLSNHSTPNLILLQQKVDLDLENVSVEQALNIIAENANLKLMYSKNLLPEEKRVTLKGKSISLYSAIWEVLDGTGLRFALSQNQLLVVLEMDKVVEEIVQETIVGVVTDSQTGEPIPGVNIVLEGTTTGTTTDFNGEYELTVEDLQGTLVYSFIGYNTLNEPINGRTSINVSLIERISELDEVMVTGYSSQRRADITGAIGTVDTESMTRQTSASVLQRLDGRVSGVTVESGGSPGGRSTVRIRGISSFQNNDPLYIVDGVPVEDTFMNFLNPNDIEEMQVLKDASAASIYGARASNGVVIIQTKKGQSGAPQVSLNMRVGRATPAHRLDDIVITDPLQNAEVARRDAEASGADFPVWIYGDPANPSIPEYLNPNDGVNQTNDLGRFGMTEDDYSYPDNLIWRASPGTNWFDELHNPALQQNYDFSVSGGSESNRYHVSLNYLDQEGTAKWNRYKRGTVRVNTEFDVGNFTFGENIGVSVDESYGGAPNDNLGEGGVVGRANLVRPIIPVYDVGGNFAGTGPVLGLSDGPNPIKLAWADKDDKDQNRRIFGNIFARYEFFENFLLNSTFGFNLGENTSNSFSPAFPEGNNPNFSSGTSENFNKFTDWTYTNTLNYVETFATSHNFDVLAGMEFRETNSRFLNGSLGDLLSTDLNARYIQPSLGDPDQITASSGATSSTLASFFGKIDYNFDQRYHLSFTVRRDGSSKFGPDNQWGTFPAASLGWRVSNESFMAGNDFLTNLMVRVGWGITGNENIPSGRLFDLFGGSTGDTFYDIRGTSNSIVRGFRQQSLGNSNLRWEENETINIGIDSEILDGKFSFSFDVYERNTDDLLFDPSTPATAGVASPPIVNVGKMQNRGIDFSLGYRAVISNDLQYSINFNGSHYRNEIIRIDGETEDFFGPVSARFGTQVINRVGYPIGSFYGLEQDGIFQNQSEVDAHPSQDGAAPGRFRFNDTNGDGAVSAADRTIIGDPHPDFTGGLDIGVNYKNWEFNTSIFATIGNDIFDVQKEYYVFRLFQQNVRRDLLTKSAIVENGQVVNPDADYQRIDQSDTFSNQYSDFYVEDGSYVRMRTIQIAYNLPQELLSGFDNVRFYLQAENLFTITGYTGLDPALPPISAGGAAGDIRDQARGIDRGSYPTPRTISLGVNVNF